LDNLDKGNSTSTSDVPHFQQAKSEDFIILIVANEKLKE